MPTDKKVADLTDKEFDELLNQLETPLPQIIAQLAEDKARRDTLKQQGKCPSCSQKIESKDSFCRSCGHKL